MRSPSYRRIVSKPGLPLRALLPLVAWLHVSTPARAVDSESDCKFAYSCADPWWTYWQEQQSRWFVSADLNVGGYPQARTIMGYGKPFWSFIGVEAVAASSSEFANISIGPRFDWIAINAAIYVRRTHSYRRVRPLVADTYRVSTRERRSPHANRYGSLDAWLWGFVPAGPLLFYWEAGGVYLLREPGGYATFEEYFRYTMNARTAMMDRVVAWVSLRRGSVLLGPAADAVLSPGRAPLVRVGGSFALRFTRHTDLQILVTLPVSSPDDYDLFTQSWGILSLGYNLATGEPKPGF